MQAWIDGEIKGLKKMPFDRLRAIQHALHRALSNWLAMSS
jgi:hypothetical protein